MAQTGRPREGQGITQRRPRRLRLPPRRHRRTQTCRVEPATAAAPAKRLNPIKLKQMEDRLKFAEEEIPRLEQKIAAAEGRLGNFTSAEQSQKDAAELDRLRSDRTTLLTEWEEASLVLEEQRLA